MDKKYLTNVLIYLLSGIVALFFIFFVIFHLTGSGEEQFSTVIANKVQTGEYSTGTGYVFRYEKPLYSSASGTVYSPLGNGERVMQGAEVARLYEKNEEGYQALVAADRALHILKESAKTEKKPNLSALETKIKKLSEEFRTNSAEGSLKDASVLLKELLTALGQMKAGSAQTDLKHTIAYMEAKRNQLLSSLGPYSEEITAPLAGGYYPFCDGYERIFSMEQAKDLTIAQLETLSKKEGEPVPENREDAGKILYSTYWFLGILTEDQNVLSMEVGKSYEVTFHNKILQMQLEKREYDVEKGKILLVFSSRSIYDSFFEHRAGEVSVQVKKHEGLKVPTAAVRYVKSEDGALSGETGVYTKNGNRVEFKKIEILTESDGYYVVKERKEAEYLKLFDSVVTRGKNLKEGYVE